MVFKNESNSVFGIVVFFIILLTAVLIFFLQGTISFQAATIFTSSLSTVITLTVLFSAFMSLEATRKKQIATSELSVRPYLLWNFENRGKEVFLDMESRNNQAFDLRFVMEINGLRHAIRERHVELSTSEHPRVYKVRIDEALKKLLGSKQSATLGIHLSFFSELGGKYEHEYHKEISFEKGKFLFGQRQIHTINMPWFDKHIKFSDD